MFIIQNVLFQESKHFMNLVENSTNSQSLTSANLISALQAFGVKKYYQIQHI